MALLTFSFLFCVLLSPLSVFCARRVGALDTPDGERKRHPHPTARLGGLALFSAVLVSSLIFLSDTPVRAALLSGGALLCVLGVSDDVFSLSPTVKLIAEAAVALIPACFRFTRAPFRFSAWRTFCPLGWEFCFPFSFWCFFPTPLIWWTVRICCAPLRGALHRRRFCLTRRRRRCSLARFLAFCRTTAKR